MAGPFAAGGTAAVVVGGHPVTAAAAEVGWPSSAATGMAAAVRPAEVIRVRRVSGRRPSLLPGSGVGEVIRVAGMTAASFHGMAGRDVGLGRVVQR